MGTSVSRRSPANDLRWRAARTAMGGSVPADRAALQLLSAATGDLWVEMLQSPSLQAFASAAVEGVDRLPRLAEELGVPSAVRALVEEARYRGLDEVGGGAVLPLAERSLGRILLTAVNDSNGDGLGSDDAPSGNAAGALFAETVRQLVLHLVSRDIAAVAGAISARETRARALEIADAGVRAVEPSVRLLSDAGPAAWSTAVQLAFVGASSSGGTHA